jgi:hypothetical protein
MHDYTSSYQLYIGTVLLSTGLAWIASAFPSRSNGRLRPNPIFWYLSLATLWFVMGFRLEVGVDYFNYQRIYYDVADLGIVGYYSHGMFLEPGYLALASLVHWVYGDFAGLFVCTSLIGLCLFYSAFAFGADRINPAWCVFIFATTQYYYYFGIDRLFLAVSVVTYGLRFLVRGRPRRFYWVVCLAAMFHVSAVFMLILPTFVGHVRTKTSPIQLGVRSSLTVRTGRYVLLLFCAPLLFYGLTLVLPHLPARYHAYGEGADLNASLLSVAMKVPVAMFILLTMPGAAARYPSAVLYGSMYITSLFVQAFSAIAEVGRLAWYFWAGLCFAFPFSIKSASTRTGVRLALAGCVACYCIVYMFHAYLGVESGRGEVMFPYRNMFFEL